MVLIPNDMTEAETQAAHNEHLARKAKEQEIYDTLNKDQLVALREVAGEFGVEKPDLVMFGKIYAAMRVYET
jgi:hypothetical protein